MSRGQVYHWHITPGNNRIIVILKRTMPIGSPGVMGPFSL